MEYSRNFNINWTNLCPYHLNLLTQQSFRPQNRKCRGKSYLPSFIHVAHLRNSSVDSVNLRQTKSIKRKKPAPYRYVTIVYSEKDNKRNYAPKIQPFVRDNIILENENYNLYEDKNCNKINKANDNIFVEVEYETIPKEIPKKEREPHYIRKKDKFEKKNLKENLFEPVLIIKKEKLQTENLGENTRVKNEPGLKLKNQKIIKNIEIRTSRFNNYGEDTTFSMTTNADEFESIKTIKRKSKKNLIVI